MNKFHTIFKYLPNNINKILLIKNTNIIGYCNIKIDNKICYINNIIVKKEYRNKNIGSELLYNTEDFVKKKYNINKFRLTAKQPPFIDLVNFYKRNGYNIIEEKKPLYYDNDDIIYELISMEK